MGGDNPGYPHFLAKMDADFNIIFLKDLPEITEYYSDDQPFLISTTYTLQLQLSNNNTIEMFTDESMQYSYSLDGILLNQKKVDTSWITESNQFSTPYSNINTKKVNIIDIDGYYLIIDIPDSYQFFEIDWPRYFYD